MIAGNFAKMIGTTISIIVNKSITPRLRLSAVEAVEYTPCIQRPVMQTGNMYLITVFQVLPTWIVEFEFNVSIKSSNL